eukprot:s1975_g6.t1
MSDLVVSSDEEAAAVVSSGEEPAAAVSSEEEPAAAFLCDSLSQPHEPAEAADLGDPAGSTEPAAAADLAEPARSPERAAAAASGDTAGSPEPAGALVLASPGGAEKPDYKPAQPRKEKQFTLKKFWSPGAPGADEPALSRAVAEQKRSRGRPMSDAMKAIYREVLGENAEKFLQSGGAMSPAEAAQTPGSAQSQRSLSDVPGSASLKRQKTMSSEASGSSALQKTMSSEASGSSALCRALSAELDAAAEESGAPAELDSADAPADLTKLCKAEAQRRGRQGGRPPGRGQKRTLETPVAVRAGIAASLKEEMAGYPDMKGFWKAMKLKFRMQVYELKAILKDAEKLQVVTKKRNLTKKPMVHNTNKAGMGGRKKRYRGFRKPGGGRKSMHPDLEKEMVDWTLAQRSYGHSLTSTMLVDRWIYLLSRKEDDVSAKAAACVWSNSVAGLCEICNLKAVTPDLLTKLGPAEEHARAMLTWQSMDRVLWNACFAPLDDLKPLVADPEGFRKSVKDLVMDLVMVFSDQVPLWVKAGPEKELFHAMERTPVPQTVLRDQLKSHYEAQLANPMRGTAKKTVDLTLKAVTGGSGQRQKRSLKEATADRYRITYEARQAVFNWLNPDAAAMGTVVKGLVVVSGTQHCRLSNISSTGRWLKDESYSFNGKLYQRKAGESCGKLLSGWRTVRKEHPELFEKLSLMTQPAATVDSIIFAWAQAEPRIC